MLGKKLKAISLIFLIIIVSGVTLLIGCTREAKPTQETLTVAAAADLQVAFREIGELYTRETGVPVEFNFGSTGLLAQQISNGAPVDVFAAANIAFVDKLKAEGLIIDDTQALYAKGRIVIAKKKGSDPGLDWDELGTGAWEVLQESSYRNLAIANPDHAPYGTAAKEFLIDSGVWGKVEGKLIYGTNIRDTLNYIISGNAEIGIVALSIVNDNEMDYILVPEELHLPLNQSMAVIKNTKLEKEAREFTQLVLSPQGKMILEKYGFVMP